MEKINGFIEFLNEKFSVETMGGRRFSLAPTRKTSKYFKVLIGTGEAYCFVEKETLDIYMVASWSSPAQHPRGNIETSTKCCGKNGIAYLRG